MGLGRPASVTRSLLVLGFEFTSLKIHYDYFPNLPLHMLGGRGQCN